MARPLASAKDPPLVREATAGRTAELRCTPAESSFLGPSSGRKLGAMERSGAHDRREYPGLASIAASARHRWWLLLGGLLAGAALATVSSASAEADYQASTKLLVGPIGAEYPVLRAAGRPAEPDVDRATSEPVLRAMRARLR